MPRKAPSNVEEVRLTLGDYERRQLTEAVDAYNRDKWFENVPYMIISGAVVGIGAAAVIAAFALSKFLEIDILGNTKKFFNDLGEWAVMNIGGVSIGAIALSKAETFKTEEEALAYYDPIIADLETALLKIEDSETRNSIEAMAKAKALAEIREQLDLVRKAKTTSLLYIGRVTEGGTEYETNYRYNILLSQKITEFTRANYPQGKPRNGTRKQALYYRELEAFLQTLVIEINNDRGYSAVYLNVEEVLGTTNAGSPFTWYTYKILVTNNSEPIV
jgi:hypothetical protein